MLKHLFLAFLTVSVVSSQSWVSDANLENYEEYWVKLMHGLMGELERREWCSMKLVDITQTINDNLYDFHVEGTINYVNGFVVSIQKIDITNIEEIINTRTIDGEAVPFATVRGRINFRDMRVGHDVVANLAHPYDPNFRSTGTFLHTLVQIQLDLSQNLVTKELSATHMINSVLAGSGVRMIYMPANNVTQAIGRRFWSSTFDSAALWARNIFIPIILELAASNEYAFPDICFNDCP